MVILAGSLQYMVSAWVNIVSLCRAGENLSCTQVGLVYSSFNRCQALLCAGCKLDIQVMFPAHELPSNELVRTLKHLGATSVSLPRSLEACIARAAGSDASMAGFMLKIAAIILSTFQEVSIHGHGQHDKMSLPMKSQQRAFLYLQSGSGPGASADCFPGL